MKKILFLTFLVSSFQFLTSPSLAQTPTATTSDEIQKIREVIQQKVKEKLDTITQDETINPKKAYLGTITEITSNKIKLDSKTKIYEFTLSEDAVFVNLKQNKVKFADLKVGQNVLILTLAKDELVYAKKIIMVDATKLVNSKNITLGKIADISTSSSVFTLIPTNNKNRDLQIKNSSTTEIITKANKALKFSDLKKGQKIICIYTNGQNSTYPAEQIIVLD